MAHLHELPQCQVWFSPRPTAPTTGIVQRVDSAECGNEAGLGKQTETGSDRKRENKTVGFTPLCIGGQATWNGSSKRHVFAL
eukprot:234918-Rhodomonas_salina.1